MLCLFSVQTSISKNKMSATSVLAELWDRGKCGLQERCSAQMSSPVEAGDHPSAPGLELAGVRAHHCVWRLCGDPKCCVTHVGSVARLCWHPLRGHWCAGCKLGLCPISLQLLGCSALHPGPFADVGQGQLCGAVQAPPVPIPCLGAGYNAASEHQGVLPGKGDVPVWHRSSKAIRFWVSVQPQD